MVDIILGEDGVLQIQFTGILDAAICDEMTPEIEARINDHGGNVVFDLTEVQMVTSAFFRLCVTANNMLGRERLALINIGPRVKKTFMIAQLNKVLNLQ